jgi:hypothetical protein
MLVLRAAIVLHGHDPIRFGSQAATGYEEIPTALTRWIFSPRLVFAAEGRISGVQPWREPSGYILFIRQKPDHAVFGENFFRSNY